MSRAQSFKLFASPLFTNLSILALIARQSPHNGFFTFINSITFSAISLRKPIRINRSSAIFSFVKNCYRISSGASTITM
jgi:hypothetical protein